MQWLCGVVAAQHLRQRQRQLRHLPLFAFTFHNHQGGVYLSVYLFNLFNSFSSIRLLLLSITTQVFLAIHDDEEAGDEIFLEKDVLPKLVSPSPMSSYCYGSRQTHLRYASTPDRIRQTAALPVHGFLDTNQDRRVCLCKHHCHRVVLWRIRAVLVLWRIRAVLVLL